MRWLYNYETEKEWSAHRSGLIWGAVFGVLLAVIAWNFGYYVLPYLIWGVRWV